MDLAEQILAAPDLSHREPVPCPEWGNGPDGKPLVLYVRKATALEMDAWDNGNVKVSQDGRTRVPDMTNASARLLVKVVVDADGKRIFRDNQAEALGKKAGDVVGRLFAAAVRLSGRRDPEEAKKNSEATPDDAGS